ncbi:MAG: molybdopterin molybdotransferase MoeA [Actinomycetota bacterium]|nr:molybdopterin molybdotransferase MoeA [Actinomycetota bacterium]
MKTVAEHLADVLAGVGPLPPIEMQLLDAHGCTLAREVTAPIDLPVFDNSAMDGYAVVAADLAGAGDAPVTLPVLGDMAAGTAPTAYRVGPGVSTRIMTGAPVPGGADAVVPVEWTDGGVEQVQIRRAPAVGANIRRRAEDVTTGELLLPAGTRLGARQLGLLAAAGLGRIPVRPRPRVVVLSTGSELVEPGSVLGPGQIPESNSSTLTAAALEAGALAFRVGIVPDDPGQLLDAIEDSLVRADVVLTTGGVSVGAYDVVKEALGTLGTVRFDKVAMQPGMPQGFGTVGRDATPIFTLPGNPVSAYVSFEVFVRPVLRRLLGIEPVQRPLVDAVVLEGFSSPPGRRQYVRAALDPSELGYAVRPVGGRGSHLVKDLARSDALIVVPEEVREVPEGATVQVAVLERRAG